MKKLITIFLLLSIFLLGCSQGTQYSGSSPAPPNGQPNPNVGGGCGVAPQNSNIQHQTYTGIQEGL